VLSRRSLVLSLPVALFLLNGCAHDKPADHGLKQIALGRAQYQQDFAVSFPADDLGRPVALKQPAKRVVAIGPGLVETMFTLGAQKQLVGRDDYADFPLPAKQVAIAGDFNGPNIEQCLALRPDLVIVQGETSNRAKFDDWQSKLGVPVAALTTTNFDDLARDLRNVGAWIGQKARANALAKHFQSPSAPLKPGAKALIETGDSPGFIAGRGTLVSEAARHAGYRNIADELEIDGYKQVNIEALLVHPPDLVIVPSKKPKAQVLATLRADGALASLSCVKAGRVVVVNGDWLLRPGPRLLEGVAALRAAKG